MDIQPDSPSLTPSKIKKSFIVVLITILIFIVLISGFFYFKNKQTFPFIDTNTIDLTTGKIQTLPDYFGTYIEQVPEVCDQQNLSKYFKSFVVPGKAGEATTSGATSIYGETTWNYILQGEISKIENDKNGTKFTLINGEEKLITLANSNTVSWSKPNTATASADLVPLKVSSSTFAPKDKVYLYYLVKCGGKKNPLLYLEYMQKLSTQNTTTKATPSPTKVASISAGLRTEANGLTGFNGKVKEIGKDYLIIEEGSKTTRVEITNTSIRVVNTVEFSKNPDSFTKKPAQNIKLSDIKKGENIDVLGTSKESILIARSIVVIR